MGRQGPLPAARTRDPRLRPDRSDATIAHPWGRARAPSRSSTTLPVDFGDVIIADSVSWENLMAATPSHPLGTAHQGSQEPGRDVSRPVLDRYVTRVSPSSFLSFEWCVSLCSSSGGGCSRVDPNSAGNQYPRIPRRLALSNNPVHVLI